LGRSFQIAKIFGIPFRLDFSWFLIFIFVTVMLSTSFFPHSYPDGIPTITGSSD